MHLRIAFLASLLVVGLAPAVAQSVQLESPGPRVSLLELYTSEGCSSCPPADRWISTLRDDPRLWREVVPVAFHVDYWDYIGWNDRFASSIYSDRQREYALRRHVSTVYTPGFVLAGKEWRSWFVRPTLRLDTREHAGRLRLSVDGQQGAIEFTPPATASAQLEAHVAILGFDLQTHVKAGENHGRTLEHDFVVLGYRSVETTRQASAHVASFPLPSPKVASQRRAIAAWMGAPGDPRPIQAVGGWLD